MIYAGKRRGIQFNLSASVERIVASGYLGGPTDDFAGAYVRFYEVGVDGKPGALQSESFLAAGDPNFVSEIYPGGWVTATTAPAASARAGRWRCS